MILFHGTTLRRAASIAVLGPDPDYEERPGCRCGPRDFSTCLTFGPFPLRTPEQYAWGKAKLYPAEGGPALLIVDVPDDVVELAIDEKYLPLSQGVVQFDIGSGLEELQKCWPQLQKRVLPMVRK